jgi:hypothetical protein
MAEDLLEESLYYKHFDQAERVRWRMCDIPWASIEKDKVTRGWIDVVRVTLESESTTFEATERFLKEFAGDVDFTQWLSVWLYEETKHPTALLRWLSAFGETVTPEQMLAARQTQPFVRSRMATLCMNVMSELVASSLYVTLHRESPEPVLAMIGGFLAGDEARHATHFFNYAKKLVDTANGDEERSQLRRDALTVLHFWVASQKKVTHPVSVVFNRLAATEARHELDPGILDETMNRATTKMFALSSKLVGSQVRSVGEIEERLGALWAS